MQISTNLEIPLFFMGLPWRRKQLEQELPAESQIEELIKGAKHASITRAALTETRRSRRLRSDTGWLHQRPLITYLESDEQPYFLLETTRAIEVEREGGEQKKLNRPLHIVRLRV